MAEQKLMIINTTVTSTFSAAMSALRALVIPQAHSSMKEPLPPGRVSHKLLSAEVHQRLPDGVSSPKMKKIFHYKTIL